MFAPLKKGDKLAMPSKPQLAVDNTDTSARKRSERASRPTPAQLAWLRRGIDQPGGKLPLFDANGQRVSERTVRACVQQGWAEQWFENPVKPDWLVCKLTDAGRRVAGG